MTVGLGCIREGSLTCCWLKIGLRYSCDGEVIYGLGICFAKQIYAKCNPQPKSFAKATDSQFIEGIHTEKCNKDGEWSRGEAIQRTLGFVWPGEEETVGNS